MVLKILDFFNPGEFMIKCMTGYKFSSFRIGSFMWLKKLRFCRLSITGTGGHCLMVPPELKDGKMPFVLYNLGGSIINLLTAGLSALLYGLYRDILYLPVLFLILLIFGIFFAALNGIPMRMGNVDNDGYNALSLGENPAALRAFWIQMKMILIVYKLRCFVR